MCETTLSLRDRAKEAKLRLLRMHYRSGVGHIGGNLSALDILVTLRHSVLAPEDRFILSKGHAAGALYVSLWSKGILSDDELDSFHGEDTLFSGHPAPNAHEAIPFATGSLGHGLSLSAGIALARRLRGEPGLVYCLMSDGEWQEGSTWEALIFLCRHQLPVTAIVDMNGLQGFGTTREVAGMDDLAARIEGFGVEVAHVDGHDPEALRLALKVKSGVPKIVFARTTKGAGISFMENRMEWHYLPLTEELYKIAVEEVSAS